MKKLMMAGLLSLGLLGLGANSSQAGLFDWLCHGCHHKCCNRCSMHICVRQYNAFSPVCFGNVDCLGCIPSMACMPPWCSMPPMFNPCAFGVAPYLAGGPAYGFPNPCCPPSCFSLGCCDSGCLPSPSAVASVPGVSNTPHVSPVPSATPTPGPGATQSPSQPSFTPPAPTPLPMMSWQGWLSPQSNNLQQVNYQIPYPACWMQGYPPGAINSGAMPAPNAPAGYYPGYPLMMHPAAYGPNYWYGY